MIINVKDNCNSFSFQDTIFVNKQETCIRTRFFLNMLVVRRTINRNELEGIFEYHTQPGPLFNYLRGALARKHQSLDSVALTQFQSIYLIPGVHETSIGKFLDLHPTLIYKGFETDNYHYEPTFKWLSHSPTPRKDINPDLMIQRTDGYYDIVDLKTGELFLKSLTVGKKERKHLHSKAINGISQLANYREYFQYSENAEFAKSQYNISRPENQSVAILAK